MKAKEVHKLKTLSSLVTDSVRTYMHLPFLSHLQLRGIPQIIMRMCIFQLLAGVQDGTYVRGVQIQAGLRPVVARIERVVLRIV